MRTFHLLKIQSQIQRPVVPDWDQHFNKKTTFRPGTIGTMNAFNEKYENEMYDRNGILNDSAVMKYVKEMGY